MTLNLYQVDAFSDRPFAGNQAAVIPLEKWIDRAVMQQIANENNLSETAFFVPTANGYELTWFTPEKEVDLCGHATLASAFVIFEILGKSDSKVTFKTPKAGELTVEKRDGMYCLNFPSRPGTDHKIPTVLVEALERRPKALFKARDYLAVFEKEEDIRTLAPDFTMLKKLDGHLIVTAKGKEADFVSRFFAPNAGIMEDPVTGSAHCTLIPYWSKVLKKKELYAQQVSQRGGELFCKDLGDRVEIAGKASLFMTGQIKV